MKVKRGHAIVSMHIAICNGRKYIEPVLSKATLTI